MGIQLKRSLFSLFLSFCIAFLPFLLLFPLKMGGLYRFVVYYPAQGEDQMSANFEHLVFILPPILSGIGIVATLLIRRLLGKIEPSAKSRRIKAGVSILSAFLLFTAMAAIFLVEKDADQILFFFPAIYLAYLLAGWAIVFIANRIFRKSTPPT